MGARFDTFQNEAKPQLTPRLGLVFRATDELIVKALYARSYLAPMWAHKRAGDPNFIGNPDLAPENFEGGDLILTYHRPRAFSVTADVFVNQVKNLINAVRLDPKTQMYSNTGMLTYRGVDLMGDARILPWLSFKGSYSFISANATATNPANLVEGEIKDIPTHIVRYGLKADPIDKLSLSLWGRTYAATRTADPVTNNSTIPSATVLDFGAQYELDQVELGLYVYNLTNAYYEVGGTVARPLARPGLWAEGSVAVHF